MTVNEEKYTPVGIVEVEDIDSGEIVYKTHNMIVASGRLALLNRVCGNGTYDLRKFYEINHRAVTVPNMIIKKQDNYTDSATQCNEKEIFFDDPIKYIAATSQPTTQEEMDAGSYFILLNGEYVSAAGSTFDSSTTYYVVDSSNSVNLSEIVLESKSYELDTRSKTDRKLYLRITHDSKITDYEIKAYEEEGKYNGKCIFKTGLTDKINIDVAGAIKTIEEAKSDIGLEDDNYELVIKFTDTLDTSNMCKIFHICCSHPDANNPVQALSSVGLLIKKSESGVVNDLFSRATIDPVFMRPGRRYVMHYTLHF